MAVAVLLCGASVALAQTGTGTVTGTVKDSTGGVIPGATISLTSATRHMIVQTVSGAVGDFVVPDVAADVYALKVTMPGLRTVERSNVSVGANEHVALGTITMASSAPTLPGVYWTYSRFDGQSWLSAVSQADLDSSPPWQESDDRVSLYPNAAIRSARQALAHITPTADRWRAGDVTLRTVATSRRIYVVTFFEPVTRQVFGGGPGPSVEILVLMNGIAIEPVALKPDDVEVVVAE